MPGAYTEVPPLAPAILQEIAIQNNYETKFLDLNLDLHLKTKINNKLTNIHNMGMYTLAYSDAKLYIKLCREWIKSIKEYNPSWLAISVFSYQSQAQTLFFLKYLKKHSISSKIVIGGPGINVESKWEPNTPSFGRELLTKQVIDYYVTGEGEVALASILQGQFDYPGINSENYVALEDFSKVPIPNFDSFLLDLYQSFDTNEKTTLSVEGSRGCVRNCTFCDIKKIWKKFKYKDGDQITQELISLQQKYNIRNFWFNDSLINGSTKAYRSFITSLAEHNAQQQEQNKIRWSSQFILKPKSAVTSEDIRLTRLAGGHTLAIGIESGSYAVRKHIGKNFTDEDIEYSFALLREHDIKIFLLMLIGYPTETEEDFQQTLAFFKKYKNLALEGTINGVQLGQTLDILPGTPLSAQQKQLGIESNQSKGIFWINQHSDLKLRISRRLHAEEYIRDLGYNLYNSEPELDFFKHVLKNQ